MVPEGCLAQCVQCSLADLGNEGDGERLKSRKNIYLVSSVYQVVLCVLLILEESLEVDIITSFLPVRRAESPKG